MPTILDQARIRDIIRVLCRMPIPRGQLQLLSLLVKHAAGLTSDVYRSETGLELHGQMGVFGASGRRINSTSRETRPNEKIGVKLFASSTWNEF